MTEQHIHDNGEQIAELDRRLRALAAGHTDARSSDDFEELFKVTHSPGWTTRTHLELINLLVKTAERNLTEAAELRGALLRGARAIAEESVVAA
jgi:hypothetical protein